MKTLVQPSKKNVSVFNEIWNNTYDGSKLQIFQDDEKIDISKYIKDLKGLKDKDEEINDCHDLKSFLDKINTIYHTRVNEVDEIVGRLKQSDISSREDLKERVEADNDYFREFVNLCKNATGKYTYSFATKVFSFLDGSKYPIMDSYVATLLDAYDYEGKIPKTKWGNYAEYIRNYQAFQDAFGLKAFTFKKIDIFLWCYGKVIQKYWEDQGVLIFSSVPFKI